MSACLLYESDYMGWWKLWLLKSGKYSVSDHLLILFFSPRHILPGWTPSSWPGHDPRSPRGVYRGGSRQSGGCTRIWSKPLTELCVLGRHSAFMWLTLIEPDVKLKEERTQWLVLSVTCGPPTVPDVSVCSGRWTVQPVCVRRTAWANSCYCSCVCGNNVSVLCIVNVVWNKTVVFEALCCCPANVSLRFTRQMNTNWTVLIFNTLEHVSCFSLATEKSKKL